MRRYLWMPFAVALAAFVLPFATVSCGDAQVEPSGADLVLRSPPETDGPNPDRLDLGGLVIAYGGGLATAAFLGFALALLAGLRQWDAGWAVLGAAIGLASLIFLKTRPEGGATEAVEVDVLAGAYLTFGAGATGLALAGAAWLRESRPAMRPLAPLVGALLIVFGYLYPSQGAAADTLDIRHPWRAAFLVLPVVVGLGLLARRRRVGPRLAAFAVGVLLVVGLEVARDIWTLWSDNEIRPRAAPLSLLVGIALDVVWTVTVQWEQQRRPARLYLLAGVAIALVAWFVRG